MDFDYGLAAIREYFLNLHEEYAKFKEFARLDRPAFVQRRLDMRYVSERWPAPGPLGRYVSLTRAKVFR